MTKRLSQLFLLLSGLILATPLPAIGQAVPQAATPAAPVLPPYLRADLYPKWLDAKAQIKWPPNEGFAGAPVTETLAAGTLIDRFGSENGTFFSPKGDSFAARALPYVCTRMVYTEYRVLKPIPVKAGKAAPWFDEPGGAMQFETTDPAFKLRESGVIEVVKSDGTGNDKPVSPCAGP